MAWGEGMLVKAGFIGSAYGWHTRTVAHRAIGGPLGWGAQAAAQEALPLSGGGVGTRSGKQLIRNQMRVCISANAAQDIP